jgi:hypothetical protein
MDMKKQAICEALRAWINQRPGLEFGNYGDLTSYRAEVRSIGQDLQHARELLRAVELRDSITGDDLEAAFPRAYSGRLMPINKSSRHADGSITWIFGFDYCTGQYWPTEYRKAACAVLASVLWERKRADMPVPITMHNSETGEDVKRYGPDTLRAGDWLRASFRREYGRGIAHRWFA